MHEKLIQQLRNSGHCSECPYNEDCNEFDSCLKDLLAADALEDMNTRLAKQEKEDSVKRTWIYEKFKGDAAIFAFCPECNFRHCPSKIDIGEQGELLHRITYQFNYCPMCGEYLFDDTESFDVIWNERYIDEIEEPQET